MIACVICCVTSFSGRLADVGESRCNCLPRVKSKCFGKTVSWSSISQTSCSARNTMEEIESCGEKCTNLYRVYKLIMISRVPSHGQFGYLEVNYLLISSFYLMKLLGY